MRAGLSTIQQTLTPEAASVLNHSIAEAARRNHGQTTPLHVAATLLASPSGYLRQACIRSHPNSSHPLQCRALELCFSVALERLPSAQNLSPGLEPPISNALMAALKRAQAHQRRGCPEQQQQPLLAVKVELEQLIVSILDDPSVSRVMREASFSSPAVKVTIEQSLNSSSSVVKSPSIGSGLGFRPAPVANRNLYLNPRLQQGNSDQSGQQRKEEVKKVFDVFLKTKKRNPVLVGDSEPEPVMRELLQKIEKKELGEGPLRNVHVISLGKEFTSDRTQISVKVKELGDSIENRINSSSGGGVILNLGDLKWLVEQNQGSGVSGSSPMQQQQMVSEMGRTAVTEMAKLLGRFGEGSGKLWLIGTATCETYLRCQVYHPSMENDWDLQAVPVAARNPPPGLFPRLGGNGILSSSVESLTPLKGFSTAATGMSRPPSENLDPARRTGCCPECMENFEQEVAKLATESEKSSSDSKQEAARQTLPQWLQIAKPNNDNVKTTDHSQTKDQEAILKQKTKELQKKWNDTCSRLHPSFHHQNLSSERIGPTAIPMANLYKSNTFNRQLLQPNIQLNKNLGGSLQMSPSLTLNPPERRTTPPGSPVRTELILGHPKLQENLLEKTHMERMRDFTGCIPSDTLNISFGVKRDKLASTLDPDSFKSLIKGLLEKVPWQPDAASAIATSVIQCKSGNNKRRGVGSKGDSWLLFAGPDRVGKKKMALALSELVGRQSPITIRLGSRSDEDEESDMNFRGKTTLDRIAEAVRRNPFSVIVLENIDRADMLVHGNIKRAMDRGRLPDSHGREVSLGSVIFILTADWLPEDIKNIWNSTPFHEDKLSSIVRNGWELQLSVGGKTGKRRPDWLRDENRSTKPRTDMGSALSFDLNEAAETEEDMLEGSRNSSGVTIEHEHEQSLVKNNRVPVSTATIELFKAVDDEIIFKPVDFGPVRSKVASTIASKFSSIVGDGRPITVDEEALEQIVGGVWFGQTSLEEWVGRVLVPSFHQLKSSVASDENVVLKLVSVTSLERRNNGELLPSKIKVVMEREL
ncbi:hypothetical protein BVC80_955g3 [Macleaya cordata]|uniref:Clp R domain-containing protein n=1 Tax=Macleaya cordata TaxID=56857 RepID=A0A200R0E9_MACCD|nr:hypothetical protein BVC80_955g3 [Macleaya cordata]